MYFVRVGAFWDFEGAPAWFEGNPRENNQLVGTYVQHTKYLGHSSSRQDPKESSLKKTGRTLRMLLVRVGGHCS